MTVSNDYNQSIRKVQELQSHWASSIQHQEIQMYSSFLGRKDHNHVPNIRLN